MKKDYQVRMSSEDYGEEVFNYPTLKEAKAGYARLLNKARTAQDDLIRALELVEVIAQDTVQVTNSSDDII